MLSSVPAAGHHLACFRVAVFDEIPLVPPERRLTFVRDSLAFLVRADSDIQRFTDLAGRRCSLPLHPKLLTDFMRANTERGFLKVLQRRLRSAFDGDLDVRLAKADRDPFVAV